MAGKKGRAQCQRSLNIAGMDPARRAALEAERAKRVKNQQAAAAPNAAASASPKPRRGGRRREGASSDGTAAPAAPPAAPPAPIVTTADEAPIRAQPEPETKTTEPREPFGADCVVVVLAAPTTDAAAKRAPLQPAKPAASGPAPPPRAPPLPAEVVAALLSRLQSSRALLRCESAPAPVPGSRPASRAFGRNRSAPASFTLAARPAPICPAPLRAPFCSPPLPALLPALPAGKAAVPAVGLVRSVSMPVPRRGSPAIFPTGRRSAPVSFSFPAPPAPPLPPRGVTGPAAAPGPAAAGGPRSHPLCDGLGDDDDGAPEADAPDAARAASAKGPGRALKGFASAIQGVAAKLRLPSKRRGGAGDDTALDSTGGGGGRGEGAAVAEAVPCPSGGGKRKARGVGWFKSVFRCCRAPSVVC
ncbi:hypothetical protein Rsub_12017 [Raphidocelis subcapitata]|uniref:Uncharacterized protein n=1 Tax=Raphidocelis subcapitata TaxID=307507 RepID=A0A2V0PPL4_9CHLO|nr:hypothetical protein Rsub_12017 [Raphidocelis subcapitata]|eukprot:GBF99125.1 hypothetical protein Rsub_12017 [Raphidocelis subcapitata]